MRSAIDLLSKRLKGKWDGTINNLILSELVLIRSENYTISLALTASKRKQEIFNPPPPPPPPLPHVYRYSVIVLIIFLLAIQGDSSFAVLICSSLFVCQFLQLCRCVWSLFVPLFIRCLRQAMLRKCGLTWVTLFILFINILMGLTAPHRNSAHVWESLPFKPDRIRYIIIMSIFQV